MISISKSVYIHKLDDTIHEYNNTYYTTNKMKRIHLKSSTYCDFGVENINKDPKLKFDEHVRISNYKNFFSKSYTLNWSE